MRKVAIVGAGTVPWRSRHGDKTWRALGFEVVKKALNDAKLKPDDINAVVYSIYCDLLLRQQNPIALAQDYLGFGGKTCLRVCSGAGGEGYAFYVAFSQVASGMADIVLLPGIQKGSDFYHFETRSRGDGFQYGMAISTPTIWQEPIAPGVPAFITASYLLPHMEKYGTPTPTQLAKASVKNHKNALLNPESQLKVDLSVDDVLNSRIIAWPTTLYQCCLMSDGASALILASEEKAKEITDTPIWISGMAASSPNNFRFEPGTLGEVEAVSTARRKAYQMAGIKDPLHELDVIEMNDIITGLEVVCYEELGLCEPGQCGRLIDEGLLEMGGLLPVNMTGGRVACGHVGGVSGIYSTAKIVQQLREEAGEIQVPIQKGRGLALITNGAATAVAILERR